MDYWNYLNASTLFDLKGLSQGSAERFFHLLGLGHSVADLLGHYSDEFGHLPVETLQRMAQAHRTYQTWRKRKTTIEEARRKARLHTVPAGVYQYAPRPDQLDAIVRTARLCPRTAVETDDDWVAVLQAGVALWTWCMDLCRKEGKATTRQADGAQERAVKFDQYLRASETLADLPPHRWLAMRRGVKEKALTLLLELPEDGMLQRMERVKEQLGPPAQERDPVSLLSELVTDDLRPWLLSIMDSDAQQQAVRSACESLAGLLRTSAVQARQLGAVYLTRSGAQVAVVVADREGDPANQRVLKAEGDWVNKVVEFFNDQGVVHIVLPTSVVDAELLPPLEEQLLGRLDGKVQILKVRPAALGEARIPLTDPPLRLRKSVASAMVLARRALDPLREWSLVDPVSIGVAEYQAELNTDALRQALKETSELCRLERRRGKRVHMGGPQTRGNAAMAKLNQMVKTIADLRAGMTVHGMVTNISHFGAFVNLGLAQEALVHISELSDSFVSNPNEVVSIGQQVTARVLAVEPARGRISLTLKTRSRQLEGNDRRGQGERGGGRAERNGPPMSKAQALANLEKLFKKE